MERPEPQEVPLPYVSAPAVTPFPRGGFTVETCDGRTTIRAGPCRLGDSLRRPSILIGVWLWLITIGVAVSALGYRPTAPTAVRVAAFVACGLSSLILAARIVYLMTVRTRLDVRPDGLAITVTSVFGRRKFGRRRDRLTGIDVISGHETVLTRPGQNPPGPAPALRIEFTDSSRLTAREFLTGHAVTDLKRIASLIAETLSLPIWPPLSK